MDPSVWGPKVWDFILTISLNADPLNVIPFIEMYKLCLPCIHCRRSFQLFCKQLPYTSMNDSSENMFKWTWTMHDMVNQKLGKYSLPYDKAKRRYSSFSCYISCMDIVDIITCMACCSFKENNREGLISISQTIPELKEILKGNYVCGGIFIHDLIHDIKPQENEKILESILKLRENIRRYLHLGKETRQQIMLIFPYTPPAEKSSRSNNGSESRRTTNRNKGIPTNIRRIPRNIRQK